MLGGMMQSIGVGGTVETSELNLLTGNVGIGTATPGAKLEVNESSSGIYASIIKNDNGDGLGLNIQAGDGSENILLLETSSGIDRHSFLASGNVYLAQGGGDVGIGTTNPSAKLHVVGDSILIATSQSPTSSGTGVQGEISWDASYLYICTATNTWKRTALTGGY